MDKSRQIRRSRLALWLAVPMAAIPLTAVGISMKGPGRDAPEVKTSFSLFLHAAEQSLSHAHRASFHDLFKRY